MSDPVVEPQYVSSPPRAVRVKSSAGWIDLAIQGPPGHDGAVQLNYLGDYVPGNTYNDGQIVIGPDGVEYLCVKDGTTSAPVPWVGVGPAGIPLPVQNGKWIKGVGGAATWQTIIETDVRSLVVADSAWHLLGNAGEPAFQNGWRSYDAVSTGRVGRFRKLATGQVVFAGVLFAGTPSAVMFTMPVGYRIAASVTNQIVLACSSATGVMTPVVFSPNGDVATTTPAPVAGGYLFLDGITFMAEA